MELREVTDFNLLEKYLKERNNYINCFEFNILQWLLQFLEEKQLFFLIKDTEYSSFAKLISNRHFLYIFMQEYKKEIKGKYDSHQIKGLVIKNQDCFWMKSPTSDIIFPFLGNIPFEYRDENRKDQRIPKLKEGEDYLTIYEDQTVQIIVFLLRRQRVFCKNMKNNEFGIEQNGYYVKNNNPYLIYPYDSPYLYSFRIWPYCEMTKAFSLEEMQIIKQYYEIQQQYLKQVLKEKSEARKKQM